VARSSRHILVYAAALALCAGCKTLEQAATKAFQADQTLVFDHSSDLLPPESLHVTSNADRQIALAWDPVLVGDVAGYVILRAPGNGEAQFKRVGNATSRFGTVFTDTGETPGALGDGQTYTYRVHPYDRMGRVSRSHAGLTATTEPRPNVPDGLTVYSNLPRKAVVTWKASEQRAVAGYAVYRCPTMAGPWERVAFADGRLNSVYEDSIPGDLRVMYYRISAVNRFGGESDMTETPIRAVTKAEPLPPVGLAADAPRIGQIALRWAPNVEPDVKRYEVWRAEKTKDGFGDELRIAAVETGKAGYLDAAVGCGETVRYRLRAIDADGLESFYSEPLEVTARDLGLALRRSGTGLVLRWDEKRAQPFGSAKVSELRSFWPDKQLATVSGASEVALPDLSPGARLQVALAGASDGNDAAPVCRIDVPTGS
jgi:fibronectin type 3 domain-containing protein